MKRDEAVRPHPFSCVSLIVNGYLINCAVTVRVIGLTVKRMILVNVLGGLDGPLPRPLPPTVRVPALPFGEPFGNSWSLAMVY